MAHPPRSCVVPDITRKCVYKNTLTPFSVARRSIAPLRWWRIWTSKTHKRGRLDSRPVARGVRLTRRRPSSLFNEPRADSPRDRVLSLCITHPVAPPSSQECNAFQPSPEIDAHFSEMSQTGVAQTQSRLPSIDACPVLHLPTLPASTPRHPRLRLNPIRRRGHDHRSQTRRLIRGGPGRVQPHRKSCLHMQPAERSALSRKFERCLNGRICLFKDF